MNKSTYDFIKEIGIPALDLLATIVIGIFIAIFIHRKSAKGKLKELLIDTYIEYLHVFKNFIELETDILISKCCIELTHVLEKDESFSKNSKKIFSDKLREVSTILSEKHPSNKRNEEANFSFYTYKFAFLLTKKRYFKLLKPLEDNYLKNYLLNTSIKEEEINEIINHVKTTETMSQMREKFCEESFDLFHSHISRLARNIILRDQSHYFGQYNNILADEIDRY